MRFSALRDAVGIRAVENPVHVRAFHATSLHLIGLDHDRLSMLYAGLDVRLTEVEHAHVVRTFWHEGVVFISSPSTFAAR